MAKLSLSRAWDESRGVLRHDGGLLGTVALALTSIPLALANFIIPSAATGVLPPLGAWVFAVFASLLLSLAGLLALIRLALPSQVLVGEAVRRGFQRLLVVAAAILIVAVPMALLAASVSMASVPQGLAQAQQIAPGMFFLLILLLSPVVGRFLVLPAVGAAEAGGPIAILRRTWGIGKGNTLRLWGTFLLIILAWLLLELAFNLAVGSLLLLALGKPEPLSLSRLVFSLAFGLLRAFETVILAVMLARIYLQLAGRVEAAASVPTTGI